MMSGPLVSVIAAVYNLAAVLPPVRRKGCDIVHRFGRGLAGGAR